MKFSNLLDLPFDARAGIISINAVVDALPGTPEAVAAQFYADHGRKSDHQEAYGALQLDVLSWSLITVEAASLSDASTVPAFSNWFSNVGERASQFAASGWRCIDSRADVQRHWAEHGAYASGREHPVQHDERKRSINRVLAYPEAIGQVSVNRC